ncbi:unnamed protein product, partial [Polarella glacialis]
APTHKGWLKRLNKTLTAWEESPSHLVGSVILRRELLEEDMAAEDALFLATDRTPTVAKRS